MNSSGKRNLSVWWAGLLALLLTMVGGGVWAGLLVSNLGTTPSIPWSVGVMAILLWATWEYLGGRWWPQRTSEARRNLLRARQVSGPAFAWSLLAGVLSIVALAGLWIVLFQLVRMPINSAFRAADFSKYPLVTVGLAILMASLVSPLIEEATFRGYFQVTLERRFRAPVAVAISSAVFALAHVPTQGFLVAKLFVYFLVGVAFGATAYLTGSILPTLPVHVIGDLTFFILVWPYDGSRRLLSEDGAHVWFWTHVAQFIVFSALAILAFRRLARTSKHQRLNADDHVALASPTKISPNGRDLF